MNQRGSLSPSSCSLIQPLETKHMLSIHSIQYNMTISIWMTCITFISALYMSLQETLWSKKNGHSWWHAPHERAFTAGLQSTVHTFCIVRDARFVIYKPGFYTQYSRCIYTKLGCELSKSIWAFPLNLYQENISWGKGPLCTSVCFGCFRMVEDDVQYISSFRSWRHWHRDSARITCLFDAHHCASNWNNFDSIYWATGFLLPVDYYAIARYCISTQKMFIGALASLMTKIITLSELFSFVSAFSRLQYEWSSDRWCNWKLFGVNACLQWRKYVHFIGEVFLYSFLRICRGYFDCTCALADQSLYAGIVYEHYCLCPGWPCARRSFKKEVYIMYRECWAVKRNGHMYQIPNSYPPAHD
jgi:hypothetical protein